LHVAILKLCELTGSDTTAVRYRDVSILMETFFENLLSSLVKNLQLFII